jgi:reactive intermediate/imine deaminase
MKELFDGGAEPPLGPLSRAIGAGDYVFVSGTVGTREDGSVSTDVGEQTAQTLDNIAAHLAVAGLTMNDIVTTTIHITKAEDWAAMNKVYERYFDDPKPARSTVACTLVIEKFLVEISAIAYRGEK